MTTTPHGQVPEALINLIDAYAETRHRYEGFYNAKTEAARNAVIEALSRVQALSAAPAVLHDIDAGVEVMAWLRESGAPHSIYSKMSACLFGDPDKKATALKAAPQQEAQEPAPSAAAFGLRLVPVEPTDQMVQAAHHIDLSYMPGQEGADRAAIYRAMIAAAPQPAPAPVSEMPYEKRKAIQEGEQIGASDAWFHARHNMLDTLDRRNVFRAGFDRGWNAALAAQGGKDA